MSDIETDILHKKDIELVYNKSFYQRVFKRSERVVSAVFYITDKDINTVSDEKDIIIRQAQGLCAELLSDVADMLSLSLQQAQGTFSDFTARMTHLASLVNVLASRELVAQSHALLISHEIDAILAEVRTLKEQQQASLGAPLRSRVSLRRQSDLSSPPSEGADTSPSITTVNNASPQVGQSRHDRIKAILRDKGQIGIKDIADVIRDVSTKSIQRDLNDLIDNGDVVRYGERRWSTYSLPK